MANTYINLDHMTMAISGGAKGKGRGSGSTRMPLLALSLLAGLGGALGDYTTNDSYYSWPHRYNNTGPNTTDKVPVPDSDPESGKYSLAQIVLIAIVAGILSIVTVVGNLMVMISFKMDKQLQTISNYFLLSLAVADLTIGLNSMPLFTVYLLLDSWPLGPVVCDTWLALDYLASNASVLNLLIISFDRYFSVTRPLTYRARRTTRRAIFMISCAWVISLILWPPWIYSWPYIEGQRMVPHDKCFIQFLETNLYVTFGTAVAAFYIPVTVMCVLYWQIWRETEKRQKDLTNLQAGNKDNSKRSTSSDDAAVIVADEGAGPIRRTRSDSAAASAMLAVNSPTVVGLPCASTVTAISCTTATATTVFTQGAGIGAISCPAAAVGVLSAATATATATDDDDLPVETTYVPTSMCIETQRYLRVSRQGRSSTYRRPHVVHLIWTWILGHCRFDRDHEYADTGEDSTSDGAGHGGSPGNTTPASVETPVQSTMSRCTSLTLNKDPFMTLTSIPAAAAANKFTASSTTAPRNGTDRLSRAETMIPLIDRSAVGNGSRKPATTRSQSSDSVYTILIRLPTDSSMDGDQPTIKMISDESNQDHPTGPGFHQHHYYQQLRQHQITSRPQPPRSTSGDFGLHVGAQGPNTGGGSVSTATPSPLRRVSQIADTMKLPLTTKLVPKQAVATATKTGKKKKKKTQERKQDRKAAKTLSAILLAFIITWTPYNVLVLIRTLYNCTDDCLPQEVWNFSYYLCYINSTVNPLCYALCNAAFRRTYVRILTCKWHTKKRHHNRGYYS